jgi:maleylpyruvate isomerase
VTASAQHLDWWKSGEKHFDTALARLSDAGFDDPTLLPGWSRRHLLGHVARNADALVNLLTWARTGEETPMYASPEARDSAIAETAVLSPALLRSGVLRAAERLAAAVMAMPEAAWVAQVRTAQGRSVPAAEVPWMRCREVWVHAADLDTGATFEETPQDVLAALVADVFRTWKRRDQAPSLTIVAGDRRWGSGTQAVTGPLPAIAAWLTGRSDGQGLDADGPLPTLPPWL